MAGYELYLCDALGDRLATVTAFERLVWTRVVNDVGTMELRLGAAGENWRLWRQDRRVEVWRILDTGVTRLVATYFLRQVLRETDNSGLSRVTVYGYDPNYLLAGRIVAAPAASAMASKTDHADDMLKAIVREQLGATAPAGRSLTALGFTVAADTSLGPVLTKDFSRRNVLQVCQDIAKASLGLGVPLYFDIVNPTPSTLEFRTYTMRRGADKSSSRSPFSLLRGTLENASLSQDWTNEANYIYAAGQGLEEQREVVEVSDVIAIGATPWARREALADGRNYSTTASLTNYGRTVLQERRARRNFAATLADAPGSRYQLDWDFGDLLRAEYDDEQYVCHVAAVRGDVSDSGERIEARLEYDG
jgi:hypothetical protein